MTAATKQRSFLYSVVCHEILRARAMDERLSPALAGSPLVVRPGRRTMNAMQNNMLRCTPTVDSGCKSPRWNASPHECRRREIGSRAIACVNTAQIGAEEREGTQTLGRKQVREYWSGTVVYSDQSRRGANYCCCVYGGRTHASTTRTFWSHYCCVPWIPGTL